MNGALHLLSVPVLAALVAMPVSAQNVEFRQTSIPAGIIDQTDFPPDGSAVVTGTVPLVSGGFSFTGWTLNGVRATDPSGGASNPARFVISGNTDAVAIYLPTAEDTDADTLPDWWEQRYFGSLSQLPTDAPDGDLLTNAEELARGRQPRVADGLASGGISRRRGATMTVFSNPSAYAFLRETSDPAGVINTLRAVPVQVPVALTTPPATNNGSRFTGWMENGVRIDSGGKAQPFSVTLTSDRTLTARYIPEDRDSDLDQLPDWQEMLLYETLIYDLTSDPDGDNFTWAEENLRNSSPVAADGLQVGGVSRRRSGLIFANSTGQLPFTINSDPRTIIDDLTYHPPGTRVQTPDLAGNTFVNYRFAWWTLNGVRMADASGAGVTGFSFDLNSASTATAHYIDPSLDTDSDGILDYLEWIYFGGLGQNSGDDPDVDTFANAEEILRNQSLAAKDTLGVGGISRRRGATITTDRTGRLPYRLTSAPAGIVEQTELLPPGTQITVPSRAGDQQANYRFVWYTLNGARVNDASGAAAHTFVFSLDVASTVVANYLDSSADTDVDGIADWLEIVYFGTLDYGAGADPDGDTFILSEEVGRGQSPAAADELELGGISRRRSATFTFDPLLNAEPPRIGAVRAVQVGSTAAILSARVNPMSAATQATFEYGPTTSYGSTAVSESILNGFSAAPMIATIGGLQPDTLYHFRVTATNALGTTVSTDGTFRTLPGVSAYEIWRIVNQVGGPFEDVDRDGWNNLLEFALGGLPTVPDAGLVEVVLDENHLHILYSRSHAALNDGYLFVGEWNRALGPTGWSALGVITLVISDDGEFQRVRHSIPRGSDLHLFARLSILPGVP